jgi:hypothetical protein
MNLEKQDHPIEKKKTNWPLIAIAGLVVLLACAVTFAIREHNSKEAAELLLSSKKVLTDPTAQSVKEFTDSLRQNHNTFDNTSNVVGGKELAISPTLLDTVAKISNIKPEQITNWQQVATTTKAELLKAERKVDSLQRVTFFYKDRYLKLAYRPGNPLDTTDKGSFDFNYNADLTITQYTTRGKVLGLPIGAKRSFTDIYSNDPRTTIMGFKTFRVQQKAQVLGFRVQAITAYSFRRGLLQMGLGSQFDVGRLSIIGSYYYSPQEDNFSPSIGARYDIFR